MWNPRSTVAMASLTAMGAAGGAPACASAPSGGPPASTPAHASAASHANPEGGHATPEAAVAGYFAGGDRCSARDLRAAFHPAAHLVSVDEQGAPRTLDQLTWWQRTEATRPCTPANDRKLHVLDREGPLALVEATSRFAAFQFHDLLLVVRTPAGWLIVDKVFERLGPGQSPRAAAGADAAIRAVIADKVRAHHELDPAFLARSHLADCVYSQIGGAQPYARAGVSEWAARYLERRDRGESGRDARWRTLQVWPSEHIAAVKLDLLSRGVRYVDHLLLVRTVDGWKIAAAAWGNPIEASGPP